MKTAGLLLIVFIAIAVVGGGLSLTGYNERLQVTTMTSTYTSATTSSGVATLTSNDLPVLVTSVGGKSQW